MPEVRTRPQWGGFPVGMTPMGAVPYVFGHHFVSPEYEDLTPELMQIMERQAMAAQPGLRCMPYQFCISGNGDVYQGRGWGVTGGATLNYNSNSIAFCFFGNFENDEPNEIALRSMAKEMAWGLHNGYILSNFSTLPHRSVYPTACPGWKMVPRIGDGFTQVGAMARSYLAAGILGAADTREIGDGGVVGPTGPPVPDINWEELRKYLIAVTIKQLEQQGSVTYTISPQAAVVSRPEVVTWQNALNLFLKPQPGLENDGKFGLHTMSETLKFQKFARKNDGRGIVGRKTRDAMRFFLSRIK